ncbi:unnamed protein product [Heligmosomoides polygyrus]|uniref:NR LBD domain-containing protein n=1 Tax=Heligmosomoides polygyrus TaxID=6339 RepID=A0A183G218_HELPZ|nr:unnamed protein product [Heligmosomoides polygyrus]
MPSDPVTCSQLDRQRAVCLKAMPARQVLLITPSESATFQEATVPDGSGVCRASKANLATTLISVIEMPGSRVAAILSDIYRMPPKWC